MTATRQETLRTELRRVCTPTGSVAWALQAAATSIVAPLPQS